ncbi:hypothetical protein [Pimelobacter simplex]|uniref:hypothetical protein n=1 Tax=Nocardioides simplex TaxID=2045 RepID=UPI003AAA9BF6
MEIAALAISVVALLAAGWSAWGTHRQARAAESQAQAAADANRTAQEALDLALAAEMRERTRQHVEERPTFKVDGKRHQGAPLLIDLTVRNNGPLAYDSVTVRPDMGDAQTAALLRGVSVDHTLADEAALGSLKAGEAAEAVLARTAHDVGGDAKLIVTAARGSNEWATIHYLKISRAAQVAVPRSVRRRGATPPSW